MFHPDNPPHPVEKLFRHFRISNEFNSIKADVAPSVHRENGRNCIRKVENILRNRVFCAGADIRQNAADQEPAPVQIRLGEIKEQSVLLLATNT